MKYLWQLVIILGISFAGEVLNHLLPFPIPASIYGLVLMLSLLCSKKLKVGHVKETSDFLLEVMPIMFIPAAAGIIDKWNLIKEILLPTFIILVIVTVIVMVVTGKVTQGLIKLSERGKEK